MVRRKARSGTGAVCKAVSCSVVAVLLLTSRLTAHTMLMDCVQHRVALTVGRANIDVDVQLVFGEWQSLLQRRQMDRDGDGTISIEERTAYERYLAETLARPLSLLIDDRRLDVMPLYDPAIELSGSNKTSLTGHQVRLSYFARTPSWLQSGSRITVSDGLWVKQPALGFLNVTGQDGFRLVIEDSSPITSPEASGGPRLMKARCTAAVGPTQPVTAVAGFAELGSATDAGPGSLLAADQRGSGAAAVHSTGMVLLCAAMAALGVLAIFRHSGRIRQGEEG